MRQCLDTSSQRMNRKEQACPAPEQARTSANFIADFVSIQKRLHHSSSVNTSLSHRSLASPLVCF
jgi:hypothetical protein